MFEPTDECRTLGREIVKEVEAIWQPHFLFYHYGKRGGHVAAMRVHLESTWFASIDLTNFFGSISRTRVARSLRLIGVDHRRAYEAACDSVVDFQGSKFLPYGFEQSMCLATLCIERSALGAKLVELCSTALIVSMYVDDILISATSQNALQQAFADIEEATATSNFEINRTKSEPPGRGISAFNCEVSNGVMEITPERMEQFRIDYRVGSEATKDAIVRYVQVVNPAQVFDLY